jgi:hypothetical protein
MKYDHEQIARWRRHGSTWDEIGAWYNVTGNAVRKAHDRWDGTTGDTTDADHPVFTGDDTEQTAMLTRDQIARITSLDDLLAFFKVDREAWAVSGFRVNKWESASGSGDDVTITPLYQVRATLTRNLQRDADIAQEALRQVVEDMKAHAPAYAVEAIPGTEGTLLPWPGRSLPRTPDPVLFELAIMDPHMGMLAWGAETGGPSNDLDIAIVDYRNAVKDLLARARHYDVERILYVVGNDMLHVDSMQDGKVGTTTAGTPQDFDSRLPKLFTAARRAAVEAIDEARLIAPVDVMIVPGNHDEVTMYRLGEVLAAWYRNDDLVTVHNSPRLRKYYQYGKNLLAFTHGLETGRKREPLPLIMATEAPDMWAATTHREWHVGHRHATGELQYMAPATTLQEARTVRVRTLPGLTPSDAWHTTQGYSHQRAATGLVFQRSGGLVALHEVYPH